VIAALQAARSSNRYLAKIELQKFIYLNDIVGYLYDVLPPKQHHVTYRFGPYDNVIQNTIDSLSFRGFVVPMAVERLPQGGGTRARYKLSGAGLKLASSLEGKKAFRRKFSTARWVAIKLSELGWRRLVDLVYAEPTYVAAKSSGFGKTIDVANGLQNSAAAIINLLERSIKEGLTDIHLDREFVADLFFDYLDYMEKGNRVAGESPIGDGSEISA
jgi:hypothetical protein